MLYEKFTYIKATVNCQELEYSFVIHNISLITIFYCVFFVDFYVNK